MRTPSQQSSLPLQPVGIVGAGTMGVEIAALHLARGVPVRIHDADRAVLSSTDRRVAARIGDYSTSLDGAIPVPVGASASTDPAGTDETNSRLEICDSAAGLVGCRLVIESIVESVDAKRQLFVDLEQALQPDCLLASNTSTLCIASLGQPLAHPERLVGMHFCHPVSRRKAVEVVRAEQTDVAVGQLASRHVAALGQTPIVVADSPGFVVNRLLLCQLNAALRMLLEGTPPEVIDLAARRAGLEKGPLELLDEIGLDVALRCGWEFSAAMPDRLDVSPLLVGLVKQKQYGCKSAAGIYLHDPATAEDPPDATLPPDATPPSDAASPRVNAAPPNVNPVLRELVQRWGRSDTATPPDDLQIARHLLAPMREEACRILDEGVVADRDQVERAAVDGLGLPPGLLCPT